MNMDWLAMVPEVALWLSAVISFCNIMTHDSQNDSDTWSGKFKLTTYVFQFVISVVSIIVMNLVA